MKFIYVATKEDKDRMLAMGYSMLKEDLRNNMWIFSSMGDSPLFSINRLTDSGIRFSLSNTLTF